MFLRPKSHSSTGVTGRLAACLVDPDNLVVRPQNISWSDRNRSKPLFLRYWKLVSTDRDFLSRHLADMSWSKKSLSAHSRSAALWRKKRLWRCLSIRIARWPIETSAMFWVALGLLAILDPPKPSPTTFSGGSWSPRVVQVLEIELLYTQITQGASKASLR